MDDSGTWISATATVGSGTSLGHGTPLIDPATFGANGPCVVKPINEELFRQVLAEHWPAASVEIGGQFHVICGCGWKCYPSIERISVRDAWIDHVMRVAAVTPLAMPESAGCL